MYINKKCIKICSLTILFIIYIYALILKSAILGNILSPIVAFVSAAIIWQESKKIIAHKLIWRQLFFAAFSWGLVDLAWFIVEEFLYINPDSLAIFMYLYLLSNIFIAVACGMYFYYNIRKWNIIQLILDTVAVGSLIFFTIWSLISNEINASDVLNNEFISTFLCFITDLFSITILVIMYISSKRKKFNKVRVLISLSIIIYSLSDLYYVYLDFTDKYEANTLIDGFFMLSIVLFAFATMEKVKDPSIPIMSIDTELPENYGRSKRLILLFIIPPVLYFLKVINSYVLFHIVSILIVYALFRKYVQLAIRNGYLLKREKSMTDVLEQLVKERTKELVNANNILENLSKKDVLTGLYNRRYFNEYIDLLIEASESRRFSVICIDLDRFKAINDAHGHEIGDKVLVEVGARLQRWCPSDVKISRAGGDEFTILVEEDNSFGMLRLYCEQIVELCRTTIEIPPYTFHVGVSLGIASYPNDSLDRETLMKYADIAMYNCKKNYIGPRYTFFDDTISAEIQRKHTIELLLQEIDFDKEFQLFYQPQYRISDDSLVGMEALLRWNNPKNGFISPGEFIPIAEETFLIIQIGEWVINEALKQIKIWNEKYNLNLVVGINMSPKQINIDNFVENLMDKIEAKEINPRWLDIEITETSAMSSNESMEKILEKLATVGINISIDDFGTGYSSLSYIKRFDIDRLKIAKELVDNIYNDHNTLLIVKAIIMMAKGMGLKAIAEGVEEASQLEMLKELECDEIQGYLYGRPVSAEVFEQEHIIKHLS